MDNKVGRFIAGIAALIWYPPDNSYLLLKRASTKDALPDEWECVTGRVDQGESFEAALYREVREEIDTEVKIEAIIGTTHFYRGAAVPENELLGVRYLCSISDPAAIRLSDEHSEYRWMTADDLYHFLPSSHWLYNTLRVAETLRTLCPEILGQF